ncbi:MAG: hypothetical protein WD648_12565 [Planctomycetaceae bacterium]
MSVTAGLLVLLLAGADPDVALHPPQPRRLVDASFQRALRAPISGSWNNVELRRILRGIADERNISILVDRRIDPTTVRSVDLNNVPLVQGLETIASGSRATICTTDSTVVIGPPASLSKLRTLIQIRDDEMFASASHVSETRRFELVKPTTIHYGDLESPRGLVGRIAGDYALAVDGLEKIPHDLWAGATLPEVDAVTALSLVLNQFDLTFEWTNAGRGIRIVPVPDVVAIERVYTPRNQSPAEAAEAWKNQIEGLTTAVKGRQVIVSGTVEQHAAVAALLNPGRKVGSTPTPPRPVPLSRQRFTLTLQRISVEVLMTKLEDKGIHFDFDREALTAAGIDLKTPISIDVKQAPADDFFHAIFDPLKLSFTIDDSTVSLKPK